MPKLWHQTIAAHRRGIQEAILDTTAALVARYGLRGVTMSQIAEVAGIGRATLYKYFPDVEAILLTWHQRHVEGHLEQLAAVRDGPGSARERLDAVLGVYARIAHQRARHGPELGVLLHRGEHVAHAEQQLHAIVRDLLAQSAKEGAVRSDVPPDELAEYCLHALGAAGGAASDAALQRLVAVTLAGLDPSR